MAMLSLIVNLVLIGVAIAWIALFIRFRRNLKGTIQAIKDSRDKIDTVIKTYEESIKQIEKILEWFETKRGKYGDR